MDLKNLRLGTKLKDLAFRILRFAGVLVVIYISMVFYLALTERQKAFPRAITHKEAVAAIQGKAKPLTCKLEDGIVLNGWTMGQNEAPVILYFPDAEEDGAQFLAEVEDIPGFQLVTFNYRGSGENKGNPSQENFETDASQIAQCATQINGNAPVSMIGRGTGAILASKQAHAYQNYGTDRLILIDPLFSIADAISQKYRALYPKFLVREDVKVTAEEIGGLKRAPSIIFDRKLFEERTQNSIQGLKDKKVWHREGDSLKKILQEVQTN